jgi:hypothetical protein
MLTFVMSTFRLNSGGNLVRFSSLESTEDAIFAREEGEGESVHLKARERGEARHDSYVVGTFRQPYRNYRLKFEVSNAHQLF